MNKKSYKSVFKQEFADLVELKRASGYLYNHNEEAFLQLDAFFIENNLSDKVITKELSDLWSKKRDYEKVSNQLKRISCLRVFCKYLNDIGIKAYIYPKVKMSKVKKYEPHIYSDEEIKKFFFYVDQSNSVQDTCPFRKDVMPIFFRVLYTSGLRVSELRLIKIKNINLQDGVLTILNAKNKKERLVPIHPKLLEKCRDLKAKIHTNSNDEEYFFMIRPGVAMSLVNVYHNFRRYLEKAGIPHTGEGPRVHDFRHTYCVNILRKWVNEGKDLMAYLPYLRTMLGHETFHETAYYVKLTSERFPYIKDRMKQSFPDLIREVDADDGEFY